MINYREVVADIERKITEQEKILDDLRTARRAFLTLAPPTSVAQARAAAAPAPVVRPRRPRVSAKRLAIMRKRPFLSHLMRSWRETNKLTQEAGCKILGIGTFRMSLMETGHEKPRSKHLTHLAHVLQLPVPFLESVVANKTRYDQTQWQAEFIDWLHVVAREGKPTDEPAIVDYLAGSVSEQSV